MILFPKLRTLGERKKPFKVKHSERLGGTSLLTWLHREYPAHLIGTGPGTG